MEKEKMTKTKKKKEKTPKKKTNFFKEVRKEVAQVRWPSRKEMVKNSVATISFVVFFAAFFYLIEVIFAFIKSLV